MVGKAQLREIFDKYATVEDSSGELYLTTDVFMYRFLNLYDKRNNGNGSETQQQQEQLFAVDNKFILGLFSNIITNDNNSKPGLISFTEFGTFENLLMEPDALHKIMFQLCNTSKSGRLSLEEFAQILAHTENLVQIPNWLEESDIIKLYFGSDKSKLLSYQEFCTFLHDFKSEFMLKIFQKYDIENTGYINIDDFKYILLSYHFLSPALAQHLSKDVIMSLSSSWSGNSTACNPNNVSNNKISYSYYSTFNELLSQMNTIKLIYLRHTFGSKWVYVSAKDFIKCLKKTTLNLNISSSQIQLLVELIKIIKTEEIKGLNLQEQEALKAKRSSSSSAIMDQVQYIDLTMISPDVGEMTRCEKIRQNQIPASLNRSFTIQFEENIYRFFLGAIAGSIGAFAVYPIDLIKTLMQNQRIIQGAAFDAEKRETNLFYKNSFDCCRKILRNEGIVGLYRGLGLQLIGVAPEKALKLAVNDFMREQLTNKIDCTIPLYCELIAGSMSGLVQVIVTNPLEIVKIRLQTQISGLEKINGNGNENVKPSAIRIIKQLGWKGLYKGSRACMLRDSVFTASYFTWYAHLKELFEDENGYNSPKTLLIAGVLSGIPSSSIATPADVIKTRLQVVPRPGQTIYNGIVDCARKIYKEEGISAFFKGIAPRVIRSSPQFGITVFGYELLQRFFYIDFDGKRPKGSLTKVQLDELEYERLVRNRNNSAGNNIIAKDLDIKFDSTKGRIGGFKYAKQILVDIQTKFGFKYLK